MNFVHGRQDTRTTSETAQHGGVSINNRNGRQTVYGSDIRNIKYKECIEWD